LFVEQKIQKVVYRMRRCRAIILIIFVVVVMFEPAAKSEESAVGEGIVGADF
jgi:hypothetical protein